LARRRKERERPEEFGKKAKKLFNTQAFHSF
jgi:hypothetical protein